MLAHHIDLLDLRAAEKQLPRRLPQVFHCQSGNRQGQQRRPAPRDQDDEQVLGTERFHLAQDFPGRLLASLIGDWMSGWVSERFHLLQVANFVVSYGVISLLFALMFKVLPDVKMSWKDVWIGAIVTAFLFSVGKFLVGLYLGHSSVASAYGAAGTVVIVILWLYYAAQIVLLGAEFTHIYANRYGSLTRPSDLALPLQGPVSEG